MASNTPNLNLLKKNPATDGADTFNIQTMLNDNWDKIDNFCVSDTARIAVGSYVGAGTCGADNPNELTFDFEPKLIIINGYVVNGALKSKDIGILIRNDEKPVMFGVNANPASTGATNLVANSPMRATWLDNGVSWYTLNETTTVSAKIQRQLNTGGVTYYYVAIG